MKQEFNAMTKAVLYFLMNVGEVAFYIVMAWGEYLLVKWTVVEFKWLLIIWVGTILAMGSCILRKLYLLHEDVKKLKEDVQAAEKRVCQDIKPKLETVINRSNISYER